MMKKEFCTAIVLAAGRGQRMKAEVQKQYLEIGGRPMICYALKAFQESPLIDEILLVVGKGQEGYCRKEIVDKYHFTKVRRLVEGGEERYHSVWNALQAARGDGYVFIHDGARPFVTREIIERTYEEVKKSQACVAGMPVKDTVKMADADGFVSVTPDRSRIWTIQTPQVFSADLVKRAYSMLMRETNINVTDDAMVVERMLGHPVKLVRGSYRNIKITTLEDLEIGEIFARDME